MSILRLAISSPLRSLFDYLPPIDVDSTSSAKSLPGTRIKVPFGNRSTIGVLVDTVQTSDIAEGKLRCASAVLDEEPLINPSLVKLCNWASQYYKHPPGEVFSIALPPTLREGKAYRPAGELCWQLSVAGKGLPNGALQRAPRQAEALASLQRAPLLADTELRTQGISRAVLKQLTDKGLIESVQRRAPTKPATVKPGLSLNQEQQTAVTAICQQLSTFSCILLEGITGSGKTEVYLRAIGEVLARGQQALVLIPEIGLTPQTLQRFQRRFEAHIVVLHSGLSDKAREKSWDDARSGRAHIVLGTRSAAFSCLARPGIIIVDEEHDLSFKQQDGFRYSARDIAVKRGQIDNIPVVLGSATPSLESLANVSAGRYQHLQLKQRATHAELPKFEIIDVRNQLLDGGLSKALIDSVEAQLGAGNQVLLFLNRRGYAPTLQCHDCGFIASCRNCDTRLTLHKRDAQLRCHHCGWHIAVPPGCPSCRSTQLRASGVGTEQIESRLRAHFQSTPLYRVDRDSMSRAGAMDEVFMAVSSGESCILVGTQMLSKGHHFPNVTLVGLIDIDSGLFSGDFRGPERMGQLITQVAGRAGRENKSGQVLLQTHYPDHPMLTTLLTKGYATFAAGLLQERKQSGMPPYGHLFLVRAEARQALPAETFLAHLRALCDADRDFKADCIGPLPAPIQRRKNQFRSQLLVMANNRNGLQRSAERLIQHSGTLGKAGRVRWTIDIDPQDMT